MDIEMTHKRDIYGCETGPMHCIWCSYGTLKNTIKQNMLICKRKTYMQTKNKSNPVVVNHKRMLVQIYMTIKVKFN